MDFDSLDIDSFEKYCLDAQNEYKDRTTNGMFAPWLLYKKDFEAIGGHDPIFAPFPYEDSDLFQRWILSGYELIQSRDALVYHLTCRGHRWTNEIKKDSDDFKVFERRARKNYLRKWGSWVKNDVYQHPILSPVYDKTVVIRNESTNLLEVVEPLFNRLYLYSESREICNDYIQSEIQLSDIEPSVLSNKNLFMKFYFYTDSTINNFDGDIIVYLDGNTINNDDVYCLMNLNDMVKETNEVGMFEIGNLKIEIKSINDKSLDLINLE